MSVPKSTTVPAAPRAALARAIPRRPAVSWLLGVALAIVFAAILVPTITADRWLDPHVVAGQPAGLTVRVPPFAGTANAKGGGVVIERGAIATAGEAQFVAQQRAAQSGPLPYAGFFVVFVVLGAIFTHHMRRSNRGRLLRVQLVSLAAIVLLAIAVKLVLLWTTASVLIVPIAALAIVPTLALDRICGLATGILAALVVSFVGPFDLGVACLLLVQASVAGLVVAEKPKRPLRATLVAGAAAVACTAVTYPLLILLTQGRLPTSELSDALHSPWYAATAGAALATMIAMPLLPIYQLLVGEITQGQLVALENLANPMLKQIAERAPGTWQHSLAMANMAEIAASSIGADGRLVRVGAYYHDLGKSLAPKYFIENLEAGETSPHDQLPPERSCDAIFAHVTEGLVAARKAGLHERIIDFMHMHHGNGVLEYFWGKAKEQGNPSGLTVEDFRYPGHPPQSRETAILAICDAVEAASRTLKKPDAAAIDSLVQRIIYGKLHLGQLDESGLSMSDLRKIAESLRDTIRHANHGRIEYPWQKEEAAARAAAAEKDKAHDKAQAPITTTSPRLDSLDRPGPIRKEPNNDVTAPSTPQARAPKPVEDDEAALAATADLKGAPPAPSSTTVDDAAPTGPRRRPGHKSEPPKPAAVLMDEGPPRTSGLARPETVRPHKDVDPVAPTARAQEVLELTPKDERDDAKEAKTSVIDLVRATELGAAAMSPEVIAPARKRAATLPPTPSRRAPTIPPRVGPAQPPKPRPEAMTALGRPATNVTPAAIDLDNAVTNPPPISNRSHRSARVDEWSDTPPPAPVAAPEPQTLEMPFEALEALAGESGRTHPEMHAMDPKHTDVTRPRIQLPLTAPASNPEIKLPAEDRKPIWASGLAARIDQAIEDDSFGGETPVVAPTKAELRALLGNPDPTRKQSVEEIRRRVHPTTEVAEDDIESAIQIAPPARKVTTAVGVAKKKPE